MAATVAAVFHMDPVDVMKGSDFDVAFRMAAANRHVALLTEAQAQARAKEEAGG